MMKKTIIVFGIIILLFIASLVAIPLFFKSTLLEKTKATINENVNAEVEFADFKLSLIRNFPNVTIELDDIIITGKGEFSNDTLLDINSLRAKAGLRQLFDKEGFAIEEIIFDRPKINLVVAKSGNSNWNIIPETDIPENEKMEEKEADSQQALNLMLEKLGIYDAEIVYIDNATEMIVNLTGINIDIAGKMYGTEAEILTKGEIKNILFGYKGVNYIENTSISTALLLEMDYDKMIFEIKENELNINQLPLEFKGSVKMPGDTIFTDIEVNAKKSGFENFLALVPSEYENYLKDIKTSGQANISGKIKGFYYAENYPSFDFNLNVSDGYFQYADLPEEIKNISAGIFIKKPQGELDLTKVNVENVHAVVKNNPVDLSLRLSSLISDPYFDGQFKGKVNFGELKNVLPMDSVNISGSVDANLMVKGKYSLIEKEEYNKIESDGTINLFNFIYDSPEFTKIIEVPKGKVEVTPETVHLKGLNINIGRSDFMLSGTVKNYINYIINRGVLRGQLKLNSSRIDFNELMKLQVSTESAESSEEKINTQIDTVNDKTLVFDIPKNIDFAFQSNINQMIWQQISITDVKGLITANNGKLVLDGLKMNMLGGIISLTGSYENTKENKPLFNFGLDIDKIDIPTTYQTLSGVKKRIPIAGRSKGKFNSNVNVKGQLNHDFNLLVPTVNGKGEISTEELQIIESSIFKKLSGILNEKKLKDVKIDDFSASVNIVNGTIVMKPFITKIAGQETKVSGNLNTQNLLNMRLDFNLKRDAFGHDIQKIIEVIPGQDNIKVVPASVLVEGPVGDPEVKINLEKARKEIMKEVKKSTKENLGKSLDKLGNSIKKLFN